MSLLDVMGDSEQQRGSAALWLDGPGQAYRSLLAELHRSLLVAAEADGVSLDMAAGLFGRRMGISIADEVLRSASAVGADHSSAAVQHFWRAVLVFEGLPLFEEPARLRFAKTAMVEAFDNRIDEILLALRNGREGHA